MKKTVFVDRDGVIIEDNDYVYRVEDLKFIDGAVDGLKALDQAGFQLIIITNQAGIARGYFTIDDYRFFSKHLLDELQRRGVTISAVYFCPHHPTEGVGVYKIDCQCRKPRTGMLKDASIEHAVDIAASWIIGDKTSDIKAGEDFGLKTILVATGYGGLDGQCAVKPDYAASDMLDAARLIIENSR